MQTEPDILSLTRDGPTLRLQLRVPESLQQFRGHFENFPLLPGVTQIDWAIRIARQHFELPPNFKRLAALKFMRVTRPSDTLELTLSHNGAGELSFRYSAGDAACASGRVLFGH